MIQHPIKENARLPDGLVCIGHSHTETLAAAAAEAGIAMEVLNFWHLPGAVTTSGGQPQLSTALRARLKGPVISMIGGAVHQDIGLMIHPRPFDFVLPSAPDLPMAPDAEIIPFTAVQDAMRLRAAHDMGLLSAVREAVSGPVFHMESPPTYEHEELPEDDQAFYDFFGPNAAFSPPGLRLKLWRLHSAEIQAYCRSIGVTFLGHPAEAVGEDGFLLKSFHGTPAHANASYGALLLRQLLATWTNADGPRSCVARAASVTSGASHSNGSAMDTHAAGLGSGRGLALEADAAAMRGDFGRAVALASAALRDYPDDALATRLVGWRMDGFEAAARGAGRPHWPPVLPDAFPGSSGIPCITAAELTGDILGGAIQHHGMLRVNGLVSEPAAEKLKAGIDRAFAARASRHSGANADPDWYVPVPGALFATHRGFGEDCGGVWAADCPPMLEQTIEVLIDSGVVDHIQAYLGERPNLSVLKTTLRRVPVTTGGDWHQDGAFLGRDVRSVNVWLPLSHCGVDASGMDIVGRRLPYVVQTGSHGANFDWTVGDGMVDLLAEAGAPILTPAFAPGDALLFDELMLHRTCVKAGMTKDRWAIESWFFAGTGYPMPQVPIIV